MAKTIEENSYEQILAKVKEQIAEESGRDADSYNSSSLIEYDCGLVGEDGVRDLFEKLEEIYNITFTENDEEYIVEIDDLVEVIRSKV